MEEITKEIFIAKSKEESCRAILCEMDNAIDTKFFKYKCYAQDFLSKKVFPTWRTNINRSSYINKYEESPKNAFPITYVDLSKISNLFSAINFRPEINYFKTNNILAFHCETCGVFVIKDGNHRLLQCALHNINPELVIFQVNSRNWSNCKIDMKNFCECNLRELGG